MFAIAVEFIVSDTRAIVGCGVFDITVIIVRAESDITVGIAVIDSR